MGEALHERRSGGVPCRHPAQAACCYPKSARICRLQHRRHPESPGRSRHSMCRVFRLHEHNERIGDALVPPLGAPAAWVTKEVTPVPKNIYGATKAAAEDLCQLFHRNQGLACVVLRTSRFFPEEDDNRRVREAYSDASVKANEYLYRLSILKMLWAAI
jgi:NAD dependent epimerase/dehydratase family